MKQLIPTSRSPENSAKPRQFGRASIRSKLSSKWSGSHETE
jgi:hypothetical protein